MYGDVRFVAELSSHGVVVDDVSRKGGADAVVCFNEGTDAYGVQGSDNHAAVCDATLAVVRMSTESFVTTFAAGTLRGITYQENVRNRPEWGHFETELSVLRARKGESPAQSENTSESHGPPPFACAQALAAGQLCTAESIGISKKWHDFDRSSPTTLLLTALCGRSLGEQKFMLVGYAEKLLATSKAVAGGKNLCAFVAEDEGARENRND